MSQRYKVSVIMPCFNHGEFLREAVASVTNVKRDDIELVVVDDGSTDERTRWEIDRLCTLGIGHPAGEQRAGRCTECCVDRFSRRLSVSLGC